MASSRAYRLPCRLVGMLILAAVLRTSSHGDEITQSGTLFGVGSGTQALLIDAFDTDGGSLQLNTVTLDLLTSTSGGYQTDGSGTSVDVFAQLGVDYYLGADLIAETEATIDFTVFNPVGGPILAALVFDSDPITVTLDVPTELAGWIGSGSPDLTAEISFVVTETPAGVVGFGAGGTAQYTIVYGFDLAPAGPMFLRGDANGDGTFDVSDAVATLSALFVSGAPALLCLDAADANDDANHDISDAVYSLSALFVSGAAPPLPPYPGCGLDPLGTSLGCDAFGSCLP